MVERFTLRNVLKLVGNHITSQFSPEMIIGMVITDFSVHSLPNFFSNQEVLDFIWHYNNGDIIPHILGRSNSSSIPLQFLSSFSHFHRYEITSIFSIFDSIISSILSSFFLSEYFSPRSSRIRRFKRKMLTCVRNGGVYLDIANINLTMNIQTDYASLMAKNYPLFNRSIKVFQNFDNSVDKDDHNKVYVQNDSPDFKMTFEEIKQLFEQETTFPFNSVFKAISEKVSSVRNDIAEFDAVLSTGEDVTLSIIPPNRLRLRQMDLFPPRSLLFFFDLLGLNTKIRKRYQYYMNRINFDFEREVHCRQKILSKYGIDFLNNRTPKEIFESVKSLQLPIFIPAPIKQFSSKHFMVTDRKPMYYTRSLSAGNIQKVMDVASQFLFDHHLVIPDLSSYNIKIENNQVSVDRLFSMKEISEEEVKGIANMVAASALKEKKYSMEAIKLLNLKPRPRLINHFGFIQSKLGSSGKGKFDIESIEREKNGNAQMVLKHSDAIFALAEMRMSLYGHLEKAGKVAQKSVHAFAKPIAKLVGCPQEDESRIFEYLWQDALKKF